MTDVQAPRVMSNVTDNYAVLVVCPHVRLWTLPEMAPQQFMATCPECGMVEWNGWNTPMRLEDARYGGFGSVREMEQR